MNVVRVCQGKPLLRHPRHDAITAPNLVFQVPNIAGRDEVARTRNFDRERRVQSEMFERYALDDGGEFAVAVDLVCRSRQYNLLLDVREVSARHIAKGELVTER